MDITPIAEGYVEPFSSEADPLVKRTFEQSVLRRCKVDLIVSWREISALS